MYPVIARPRRLHQTEENDGVSFLKKKFSTFAKKTHGSVAHVPLMFEYLLARLASKNGKTDIGDTLVNRSRSRMVAYPHFLLILPFEP